MEGRRLSTDPPAGFLHEYVNPYFQIECTRNQKPNLENRSGFLSPLFREGIDLLTRRSTRRRRRTFEAYEKRRPDSINSSDNKKNASEIKLEKTS